MTSKNSDHDVSSVGGVPMVMNLESSVRLSMYELSGSEGVIVCCQRGFTFPAWLTKHVKATCWESNNPKSDIASAQEIKQLGNWAFVITEFPKRWNPDYLVIVAAAQRGAFFKRFNDIVSRNAEDDEYRDMMANGTKSCLFKNMQIPKDGMIAAKRKDATVPVGENPVKVPVVANPKQEEVISVKPKEKERADYKLETCFPGCEKFHDGVGWDMYHVVGCVNSPQTRNMITDEEVKLHNESFEKAKKERELKETQVVVAKENYVSVKVKSNHPSASTLKKAVNVLKRVDSIFELILASADKGSVIVKPLTKAETKYFTELKYIISTTSNGDSKISWEDADSSSDS